MVRTLKEFDVEEKRVLVRCDFDVPLSKEGEILDDFRIRQALPTIGYLMGNNAKVILIGHLGRPEGKVVKRLRSNPIAKRLGELLDRPVTKLNDCVGLEVEKTIGKMQPGEIFILENLRFHKEEEKNDEEFAKKLAGLGDFYINNAFANSHRNHASMTGISKYLPSAAGLDLVKEIEILSGLVENPKKPLVLIIGGSKVEETKLKVIDRFSETAETFLLGGLVAEEIREKKLKLSKPEKIVWPIDETGGGKDIGPKTVKLFKEKISVAKTIFWNGPLGMIEKEEFSRGTKKIAKAIIGSCAFSVVGGGETVEFINKLDLADKFNHISTGGGAMLEFLSGEKLPGIESLKLSQK